MNYFDNNGLTEVEEIEIFNSFDTGYYTNNLLEEDNLSLSSIDDYDDDEVLGKESQPWKSVETLLKDKDMASATEVIKWIKVAAADKDINVLLNNTIMEAHNNIHRKIAFVLWTKFEKMLDEGGVACKPNMIPDNMLAIFYCLIILYFKCHSHPLSSSLAFAFVIFAKCETKIKWTPVPTSRGDLIDMFIEFGIEWQKQRSFSAIDYKNINLNYGAYIDNLKKRAAFNVIQLSTMWPDWDNTSWPMRGDDFTFAPISLFQKKSFNYFKLLKKDSNLIPKLMALSSLHPSIAPYWFSSPPVNIRLPETLHLNECINMHRDDGKWDLDMKKGLILEILKAIAFLHSEDILYLSFNADCIKATHSGKWGLTGWTVQLTDFSASIFNNYKSIDYEQFSNIRQGMVASFMPPEVLCAKQGDNCYKHLLTPKTDIFMLGSFFYSLEEEDLLFPDAEYCQHFDQREHEVFCHGLAKKFTLLQDMPMKKFFQQCLEVVPSARSSIGKLQDWCREIIEPA